ncbi:hypothetical protein P3T40_003553 [Paraburkholderia sp. EB58]|uniref:hypothetical protein n=1 Tax=Paraburkholderia sp. EB58 TaxID=3035125 RepID=UPI003D263100
MSQRIETHIFADAAGASIEVTSSIAFRKSFFVMPTDLVDGPCAREVKFYDATMLVNGTSKTVEACDITLHVRPETEACKNLIAITPTPIFAGHSHKFVEWVELEINFSKELEIILSSGVLVRTVRHADDYEFSFTFTQGI